MLVVMAVLRRAGAAAQEPAALRGAELVVVYAALVVSAPLMTQGLWGRMAGLLAAVPNNADFKTYDSLPSSLWPHGPNLVRNGRFERGLEGFETAGFSGWEEADAGRLGRVRVPVLVAEEGGAAELSFTVPRRDQAGREVLFPGERIWCRCWRGRKVCSGVRRSR